MKPGSTSPAANGWTGGQYSLFRALLSLATLPFLWTLVTEGPPSGEALGPWFPNPLDLGFPWMPVAVAGLGSGAAALLALGVLDRAAAIVLALTLLFARDVLPTPPGLAAWPVIESFLVLHALAPAGPFGSWTARGRTDPADGWHLPDSLWFAGWVVIGLGHLFVGADRALVATPDSALLWAWTALQVGMLPLSLSRRARPWIWGAVLVGQAVAVAVGSSGGAGAMILVAHVLLLDPDWLTPDGPSEPETIFYDGNCGLCHRWVRFVLAEDPAGRAFRFSALQSAHFAEQIPEAERAALPDSILVRTADGELLERSRAVLHIAGRLGGLWRVASWLGRSVPRPLADVAYDGVARIRHRLFRTPEAACPLLPPHLRERFVD